MNEKKPLKILDSINIGFVISVAVILIITVGIFILLLWGFSELGYINLESMDDFGFFIFLTFAISSVGIGFGLSFICRKLIFDPVNDLLEGFTKLSEGKYDTRLEIGKYSATNQINEKFNSLAIELENKEIFSQDFINNFSHELKTPIVSIKGLVSLLDDNNLPKEKQKEYIEIIKQETDRLSLMTTNILNLTKYENQEILTDISKYNLSEQIRTCILLLEKKWTEKNLTLDIDFDEYDIYASEDMLKQVWINLLDNAVKFAYKDSILKVDIKEEKKCYIISISNQGKTIDEDKLDKIYNKFYQVDKFHSKEGNGIGLSIVKRIIDLHKGMISVESKDELTTFSVTLNKTYR